MGDLGKTFNLEIVSRLQKELAVANLMAVPRIVKIVLNMGLKDARSDQKLLEEALSQLASISGQKPVVTRAKKAIANFKLRKGDPIGVTATLRGKRMYDFFERLIHAVLPRVRDFHGVSTTSFDGHGNYSIGFSEISVFPEVDTGNVTRSFGVEVTICTSAKNDDEAKRLLEVLGMPFMKVRS